MSVRAGVDSRAVRSICPKCAASAQTFQTCSRKNFGSAITQQEGEQVLERAPASGPLDRHLGEDKQSGGGRRTINKGRGQQQWREMGMTMTMHSNYINIKTHNMPV